MMATAAAAPLVVASVSWVADEEHRQGVCFAGCCRHSHMFQGLRSNACVNLVKASGSLGALCFLLDSGQPDVLRMCWYPC